MKNWKISGLAANLDETNVIPFGKHTNPGNKICHELEVNWTDSFKLLGLEIDNKLELMGQNFDKTHVKAQYIISAWKSRNLPMNGRITISKCLIVSQFDYVASIIKPTNRQIQKNQDIIKSLHKGQWSSLDITQKINTNIPIIGGLNCIKLKIVFMSH